MDSQGSPPAADQLSDDEEALPKPLKIIKKRQNKKLDSSIESPSLTIPQLPTVQDSKAGAEININDGSSSSTVQNLQLGPLIPSRNGSLLRSRTHTSILKRSPALPPQSINGIDTLTVQAQGFVGGLMPRTQVQASEQVKSSSSKRKTRVSFDLGRLPQRALSTGSRRFSQLLSPFIDGPIIPIAPTPILTQPRPRAATISDISRSEDLNQNSIQGLKRRSSIRERLMSRVRSGITSKPNSIKKASDYNRSARKSDDGSTQDLRHEITRHQSDEATPHGGETRRDHSNVKSTVSIADTISSVNTTLLFGSELDHVLTEFPSPPKTGETTVALTPPPKTATASTASKISSNTKTKLSALVSPPSVLKMARKPEKGLLGARGYISMNSAEVNAVSEIDSLDSANGKSFFVAIEIKGTFGQREDWSDVSQYNGLEVAVIIDNSILTSPATLMACCETARHIATLLDMSEDKLTILSTTPLRTNVQSRIVLPLSAINTHRVKSAIDTISTSSELPNQKTIRAAIECAIDMFTAISPHDRAWGPNPSAFGQVFLLTANPSGLPPDLLHPGNQHVHVICPGSIPWKGSTNVTCNGWNLRSSYRDELEFVSKKKDEDATSLFNRLETVITNARHGIISGNMTDLVLEVNSGADCSIVGVIGKDKHSTLQPGEVITALIKVKVRTPFASPPRRQSMSTTANSSDLLEELESILGETSATLLKAKLRYSHSFFPLGTRCSIKTEAPIKQRIIGAKFIPDLSDQAPQEPSFSKVWVQKRLIYHLATHHSPRLAIATLTNHFSDDEGGLVCPQYFGLVMEELRYQSRITERLQPSDMRLITQDDDENVYEHFGCGLFKISNYKPQGWMPGYADDDEVEEDQPVESALTHCNWEIPGKGQGLAVVYDPSVEGEWLANVKHKTVDFNVSQPMTKKWIPDTRGDDGEDGDDGSDKDTVIFHSKYTLDKPSNAASKNKSRNGFINVSDENSPFGGPATTIAATKRTETKRANQYNLSTVASASSINRSESYNLDRDRPAPTPPLIFKSQSQPQSQVQTPNASNSSLKTLGASKPPKGVVSRLRQISRSGSQKRYVGRPTAYPPVIIVKNNEERIRVMREMSLSLTSPDNSLLPCEENVRGFVGGGRGADVEGRAVLKRGLGRGGGGAGLGI